MISVDLSADEVLTTTRAVRRKLDLDRPVSVDLVRECLEIGLQAPTASNLQLSHFVVVTSEERRQALAGIYRRAFELYRNDPSGAANITTGDPVTDATQRRVGDSAAYLAEHLHRVPVLVVPCVLESTLAPGEWSTHATLLGSVIPAAWSFCLAARARGLGTSWTTLHLLFEAEAAEVLDLPGTGLRQAALIPVAHTTTTGFGRAGRAGVDSVVTYR